MKRLFIWVLCLTLCLAMSGVAGAELVVNGNFQKVAYDGNGNEILIPSWDGWTLSPASQGSNFYIGGCYVPGPSMYQAIFTGPGPDSDAIGQSILTVPGTTYTFSFWLAQPWPLTSSYSPGDFEAYWNGTSVLSITDTRDFGWTQYSFSVVATEESTALAFSGRANVSWDDARGFFLTGISVEPGAGSQVPVPSTLWLLGSGLVGLVGLRRFRKG